MKIITILRRTYYIFDESHYGFRKVNLCEQHSRKVNGNYIYRKIRFSRLLISCVLTAVEVNAYSDECNIKQ